MGAYDQIFGGLGGSLLDKNLRDSCLLPEGGGEMGVVVVDKDKAAGRH